MKKGETKSNRTTKGGKINYERLIRQTAELEQAAGNLLIQIDKNKKKLQEHFDKEGLKEMVVDAVDGVDGAKLVCKKQERCTIKYDVERLKERFDDDLFIEMTKRSYKINNINAMVSLMKDAGVKAKDFKALLDVVIVPNNAAIKELYDHGEVTMDQLKGTFEAKISKTIKIVEETETGDKD